MGTKLFYFIFFLKGSISVQNSENKVETEAEEIQRQRYVTVEPQLPSSSTPLFDRAPDGEGLFGRGGCEVCTERGEPKIQTLIMVLPPGVDIIEFVPKGREMVVVENHIDTHREVGEEVSLEEECEQLSWEESYLLWFSKS